MRTKTTLAALSLGLFAFKALQPRPETLKGQVVFITGGSRGLGFALAREFAREGCRIVICARDPQELRRAQLDLRRDGAEVLAIPCDVTKREQVEQVVYEVTQTYGRIDILVNNAGVMVVGPVHTMTLADFEEAMDVMYWGLLYTIWAVLPQMRQRQQGRIINITSIGGKVSVPHLLPYNSAKFAAVGLSEGLQAELAGDGIQVTTIVPGLMRTGSYLNAHFKGDQRGEYTWFSLGASLPLLTINAERAARQIVQSARRGDAERTLTIPAQLLARFHGAFPSLTIGLLNLVDNLVLPDANPAHKRTQRGMVIRSRLGPAYGLLKFATTLGQRAARRLHQYPGPNT
jgi:NAD(P)-dependent dehydrogenase (short-subunit alcohol dehydrogenase family)